MKKKINPTIQKEMTIIFDGEFTDLNEYILSERGSLYGGSKIKKNETRRVMYYAFNNFQNWNTTLLWFRCIGTEGIAELTLTT